MGLLQCVLKKWQNIPFKSYQRKNGWRGRIALLKMFICKKKKDHSLIKLFFDKKDRTPIFLRANTSDIPTFNQVIIHKEYGIPLAFTPVNILDAGANIGLTSLFFARTYPNARIIAVEPALVNYELMLKNTSPYRQIIPLHKALSNRSEQLNVADVGLGMWGFVTSPKNEQHHQHQVVHSVETTTIPDLMTHYQIDSFDIVKMDIEGYEKHIFESHFETWLPKTKCVMIELHDRMNKGCSKAFFHALHPYDFSIALRGELIIATNNALVSQA